MATKPVPKTQADTIAAALPVITGLAALALAALAYFLLYTPQLAKIVPMGSLDLGELRQRQERLQDYAERLDRTSGQFELLNDQIRERVDQIVTEGPRNEDLFVMYDEIASRHGMVLSSIDTQTDAKGALPDGRKPVRVSISVVGGTYTQLKSFLTEVENAIRVTDVLAVSFNAGGATYSINLRTYYADQSSIVPIQPAPASPVAATP